MNIMDDEPTIILLYVDDLFLTGNEEHIRLQEESRWRIWDERYWINALFPRAGSVENPWRNISKLGKVCSESFEKIWYVGMKSHGHTHGFQPEVVSQWLIRVSGSDSIQTDYWVVDVSNQY